MKSTRREWMLAIGAIPVEAAVLAAQTRTAGSGARGRAADPLPDLPPAPTLPDKASFPNLRGTYLSSAATHPRPAGATALLARGAAAEAGEPDGFRPSAERVRETFATLINADPSDILFVPSTQSGESFVAAALGLPERGAHVVSDELHFVGSQMMYTDMATRGVEVTWVKMTADGRIPLEAMDLAIVRGKTRLVAVSATSFVNGFQHDLKRLSEIAHAKGAMVFADLIQAAGNAPIDIEDSGIDAACCGTYKWLMSAGTAFLYVRRSSQARMQPPFYHHSQETTPLPTTHMYPFDAPGEQIVDGYAHKDGVAGLFSMGYEPCATTLAGLEYSLPYILRIGVDRIQAHAQGLVGRLKAELPRLGYPLLTPLDARSPIVTVVAEDAQRLAPALRAAGVNVTTRWNHVRIGVSVFNDMEDVERLLAALPAA